MLDQRLSTVPQHQWISKLFGFDFSVEYRPGRLNTVADALSRREQETATLAAISGPTFALYDDIRKELQEDEQLRNLRDFIADTRGAPWRVAHGLILCGTRVYSQPRRAPCPRCFSLHTRRGMRAHRRLCNAYVATSPSTMTAMWCTTSYAPVPLVSGTRRRHCTRPAYSSHWTFCPKFGLTFLWISWKDFPR